MAVDNRFVVPLRTRNSASAALEQSGEPQSQKPRAMPFSQGADQAGEGARANPRRELGACVAWLLESGLSDRLPLEKRVHRRYPFRKPITVTPVNSQTGRPDRLKSFSAFGIDISSCGVCFLARQLVPVRKAILSAEGPSGEMVTLLFEPRWVRFTRGGWYQTGGRLVQVLPEEKEPFLAVRLVEAPPELEELCENSRHSHPKSL
jgi:hypothetical protein